jgi:hypothetical protein
MYAQQRMDIAAIVLLDSIVLQNTNEKIRDRAKNILEELKNRNQIETYLSNLNLSKEILDTSILVNTAAIAIDSSSILKTATPISATEIISAEKISTEKTSADSLSNDAGSKTAISKPNIKVIAPPLFTNDSSEQYYIAFATQKVSTAFVKEMQTAFTYLNNDEFKKQKLNVTYVQFNENSYIVWIGPFVNNLDAKTYMNKVKPRLSTEIISFVPPKQYEIYLLSKSNILLIKDEADLKQYQQYMFKNIYKP